jgi:hypothetical protein
MAGSASTWQGQIHGDRDVQDSELVSFLENHLDGPWI